MITNGVQLVFGHIWALWWWRLTQTNVTADSLLTNLCILAQAPSATKVLEATGAYSIREAHIQRGIPQSLPLEILSRDNVPRTVLAHIKIRRWNGFVPVGSLCRAGDHLTCSPEFCFALIGSDIRRICQEKLKDWQYIVILAELGCELCGFYSKLNTRRGFKNRNVQLVTVSQMRDFACSIAHERGAAIAYEALRWVIDCLNSPMETTVYLLFCLPRQWGGLELPRPRANFSLPVPNILWGKTSKRHVIPDLYWPEYGLVVEFFGEEFHAGNEREDLERQEIEQDMGLKVVTLWKDDVTDLRRFRAKAESIARYMGRQLPPADANFNVLQAKQQAMLVRHQRWV